MRHLRRQERSRAGTKPRGVLRVGIRRIGDSVRERIVSTKTIRILVTLLLVASAGLFAVGVAIERNSKHHATHAVLGVDYVLAADQHAGESAAHRAAEQKHHPKSAAPTKAGQAPNEGKTGHRETGSESGHTGESAAQLASEKKGERVFGIDIESPALVIAAVAVSLILAAALWLTGSVLAPLALAGFALVAAIFDVREVFHQIDESRTNLTIIASIVAALHLAVVAGALVLARRSGRNHPASLAP
jgi:hypothetical protein